MKKWTLIFMSAFLMFFTSLSQSFSADRKVQEVNFDEDLLVDGKYHFSAEGVVTVEKDKILDALLKLRKDFRDRIARTAQNY